MLCERSKPEPPAISINRSGEDVGNLMRRKRDQTDRLFRLQRAEAFDDPLVGSNPQASLAQRLQRDEVAVGGLARHARRHHDFARRAALFDRQRAAAAAFRSPVDAERARPGLVDDPDDAPARAGLARRGVGVELTRSSMVGAYHYDIAEHSKISEECTGLFSGA